MPHWTVSVARLEQFKKDLPKLVGNEMVNYALDNMDAEAFDGKKWPARKPGAPRNQGRKLLVDSGDGRRSIGIQKATQSEVQLTANEYMQAHNEGETIRGTYMVRSHTRNRGGKTIDVSAHSRTVNFTLPERRFSGKSAVQTRRIQAMISKGIIKALT